MSLDVLLLNQYFAPDIAPTAQLLGDLGEDLVASGMTVTAVASSACYAGAERRLPRREVWRGVHVRRVRATKQGRANSGGRVLDYATYLFPAAVLALARRCPDVVVCLSTPPLVAILGVVLGWRGARFVYKVEDLYPDLAFALGVLPERSALGRMLSRLSRGILRRADAVVALDEAMGAALEGRGARRVEVIPNWADGVTIRPDADAGDGFRREHGLGDRYVVLYAGNHGLAHRFDAVLEAAKTVAVREPRVLFLFAGDGPRRTEVGTASLVSDNVRLVPYQPAERLNALLNAADIHLVTLRDEAAGLIVPSKYASALATGKPVLMVGGRRSAMAGEIESKRLGFACSQDAQEVARAVLTACGDPSRMQRSGENGRRVFEDRYERRQATARWTHLIGSLARPPMAVESNGG